MILEYDKVLDQKAGKKNYEFLVGCVQVDQTSFIEKVVFEQRLELMRQKATQMS